MVLALLTLLTALAISAVAAYYSIIGLIAIFSSAVIPIAVMGVVLETGKLVTAAWVYHHWKRTPVLLKTYLISAVVILMFITSMGIFGFLSKAHIEQTTITSDNTLQIELIESQIQRERTTIKRAEDTLGQLDSALEKYVELGVHTKENLFSLFMTCYLMDWNNYFIYIQVCIFYTETLVLNYVFIIRALNCFFEFEIINVQIMD